MYVNVYTKFNYHDIIVNTINNVRSTTQKYLNCVTVNLLLPIFSSSGVICSHAHACMHISLRINMFVQYVCMYVCMYVCNYVYMHN